MVGIKKERTENNISVCRTQIFVVIYDDLTDGTFLIFK